MRIGVYGTLRPLLNMYGWIKNQRYIGTIKINGYNLYYKYLPWIKKGDYSVVIDVMDYPIDISKEIISMEIGAGYKDKTIKTKYGDIIIFVGEKYLNNIDYLIKHGDFVKYIREKNEIH